MLLSHRIISRVLTAGVVAAALLAGACERVVDLDLEDGPRRLVVEARLERSINAVNTTQTIKLSTTSAYFGAGTAPPARNAVVRITSNTGDTVTFAESPVAGTYTTNALNIQRNRRYTLHIEFEGQRYEATETTQPVAPILALYFDPVKPGRFAGTKGVRATIDFEDPAAERNFYLWDQYVNGVRQLGPDSAFKMRIIAADDALNGIRVEGFQPFEGIDIPEGTTVRVRQIGISEAMFRYYYALSDQVAAGGSPFSVPPASIRGNVANLTNPSVPALGYFSVSEVSEITKTR
jgi:hypothetical protein